VFDTGILLLSRGVGLMFASALLARYDSYLPPKTVLVVSFAIALVSGYMMAQWTADVSTVEVFWINMVQGAAAGAIFIAINTLTFSTLPNHLKTEGFALYYTLLFTGATVGIAAIVTILTRMTQVAHSVVGAYVNPFNDRFRLLAIPEYWDPHEPQGLIALEQEVLRQAEMIAYSDAFLAAALIALIGIPLALMYRSQKPISIGE
jgi:DHA2 family multidrug resistance protein